MSDGVTRMLTNGSGAAAVLAAATGCFALGILALTGDGFPSAAKILNIWNPTGPLSGVTDAAILVWLAVWILLSRVWKDKNIDMGRVGIAAVVMIFCSLLLTFPPFMDLLQGK